MDTAPPGDAADWRPLFEAGRRAWPELTIDEDSFRAFLAGAEADEADEARAADLYLACACARRDEQALAIFARLFTPDLDRIAVRARAPGVSPEDARQMLLDRLLVSDADRTPRIASYRGRGSLRNWIRAAAARALIDLHRAGGRGREVTVEHSLFEQLAGELDPEMAYLRRHYRDEFAAAFEVAVRSLSPRDRNHLRHVFVQHLTIDQIGAIYGVHRATAARRLAAARDALLAATRAELGRRLDIEATDIDSIIRLLGSQFDLSLQRIFTSTSAPPPRAHGREPAADS